MNAAARQYAVLTCDDAQAALSAGWRPLQEPQNMAGLSQGGDLRIRAVVAVEGRARLVPLA
ncbi:hypothetical protein [Streptomyces sp. 3N207]|uniref:hypothetical protein n=1 Tax=Streptomyces sp. 3N207 TaxID=3457417 RepID=UPI003FD6B688